MIAAPPKISELLYGTKLNCGLSHAIVIADFDFETYSEAGYYWDEENKKWRGKGLLGIGLARYAQHPSTEVLSLAYNLKDGTGAKLWKPGQAIPYDLFQHLGEGLLLEAWNIGFEYWIWEYVCVEKYGFLPLKSYKKQLRCAMAKACAFAIPAGLDNAGKTLNTVVKKDTGGKRLLDKFSKPRSPTKRDQRLRIQLAEEPEDAELLFKYNLKDIETEAEISALCPDLSDFELSFWQADQAINTRGVRADVQHAYAGIEIIEQAQQKYNPRVHQLTGGRINTAGQVGELLKWVNENLLSGHPVEDLNAETIETLLERWDIPPEVREVLKIRQLLSSASVKKLYAIVNTATEEERVHNIFRYHGARTGRATGNDLQPQNLPAKKIDVNLCNCGKYYANKHFTGCPFCLGKYESREAEWDEAAVNQALECINVGNLNLLEYYWGDALETISACVRGLLIAGRGKTLICSDYSAIEAVVLAARAGEQWRLDVFNTHGKIYEASASKISGIPLQEILDYKKINDRHHPIRKLGKVAELASGYQGGIGGWKAFGAEEHFKSDDEIRAAVSAWRRASPRIVDMWYRSDRNAKAAVLVPDVWFDNYFCHRDILYCKLLSGRTLTYHTPKIVPGKFGDQISYLGWNTSIKNGPIGWTRMLIYGGKFVENEVQATARDILANAIVNLEKRGYPVVLHIHDEIVCEIPRGFGSLEEFECIMSLMPTWAKDWPIKATGGWCGQRYRK